MLLSAEKPIYHCLRDVFHLNFSKLCLLFKLSAASCHFESIHLAILMKKGNHKQENVWKRFFPLKYLLQLKRKIKGDKPGSKQVQNLLKNIKCIKEKGKDTSKWAVPLCSSLNRVSMLCSEETLINLKNFQWEVPHKSPTEQSLPTWGGYTLSLTRQPSRCFPAINFCLTQRIRREHRQSSLTGYSEKCQQLFRFTLSFVDVNMFTHTKATAYDSALWFFVSYVSSRDNLWCPSWTLYYSYNFPLACRKTTPTDRDAFETQINFSSANSSH